VAWKVVQSLHIGLDKCCTEQEPIGRVPEEVVLVQAYSCTESNLRSKKGQRVGIISVDGQL